MRASEDAGWYHLLSVLLIKQQRTAGFPGRDRWRPLGGQERSDVGVP
jgi:hypothetical protein